MALIINVSGTWEVLKDCKYISVSKEMKLSKMYPYKQPPGASWGWGHVQPLWTHACFGLNWHNSSKRGFRTCKNFQFHTSCNSYSLIISSFRCKSWGRSSKDCRSVIRPPLVLTSPDFSISEAGISLPLRSSSAAGRFIWFIALRIGFKSFHYSRQILKIFRLSKIFFQKIQ